jgi:hypothetical protein
VNACTAAEAWRHAEKGEGAISNTTQVLQVGEVVGYWKLLYRGAPGHHGFVRWLCQCRCLTIREVYEPSLKRHLSRSCGCLTVERNIARCRKAVLHDPEHAIRRRVEVNVWYTMLARCTNPRHKSYAEYGGRGITVCQRWRDSFEAFLEDMGPRPSSMHSLERLDNDGPYDPGNVVWATPTTQARNRRSNRLIEWNGETRCLMEWAERTGIHWTTLKRRFDSGWTAAEALTISPRARYWKGLERSSRT